MSFGPAAAKPLRSTMVAQQDQMLILPHYLRCDAVLACGGQGAVSCECEVRSFVKFENGRAQPDDPVALFNSNIYLSYSSSHLYSRARSLRNLLVSGNECGRVFPAGVGPGSPSRDAANWLPSRFSLSVETRRRYGWLRMMVFPGARLFPSPNLVPFGRVAARERQGALSRRAW